MNEPLVSVLMPCFNARPYVRQAVDSVLSQSWSNIECIVVDDGSSDGSVQALCGIADARLQVHQQPNRGAAAARNKALRFSKGSHVLFMDADDLMGDGNIRVMVDAIRDEPGAIAIASWARFHGPIPDPVHPLSTPCEAMAGEDWLISKWLIGEFMTQPGMFLIPRGRLEDQGPWNESLSLNDDFEFFTRMLAGNAVMTAPAAMLHYRSGHAGVLSSKKSADAVRSNAESILMGVDHVLRHRNDASARRACANALMFFVFTYFPYHRVWVRILQNRAEQLGGADLVPDGTPRFHAIRKVVGWRAARLVHLAAQRLRLSPT